MPHRHFPGLIILACVGFLFLCPVRPALAADIDTAAQALDRLLAQMPQTMRATVAVSGETGPRQGEVVLTLDAREARLGRGPGWLFGLTLPNGDKRAAFVAADGSSRFVPVNELPAGLSPISLPASAVEAAPIADRQAAVAAVTDRLLGHSLQGRRVYVANEAVGESVVVPLLRGSVSLSGGPGWLVFIDDVPRANWAHGCRFVLAAADGALHVASAMLPPADLGAFTELTTWPPAQPPQASDLAPAAPQTAKAAVSPSDVAAATDAVHRYAVILSGGANRYNNHVRYWNDCAYFFKTLKAAGFLQDHIYVLFADGADPAVDNSEGKNSLTDFDADGVQDIKYSATKANIAAVFNELAGKLDSRDLLYIFTTDHGGPAQGNEPPYATADVVLNLWGEDITNAEFAAEVNKVQAGAVAAIFEQCFSGGMIEPLKAPNRVLMSAARYWELSYAMGPAYDYDEFSYYVTQALADPTKGDSNGDLIVTLEEAYSHALAKDSVQAETLDGNGDNEGEHPSYYSNPWNLGRQLALGGRYAAAKAPTYGGLAQYQISDAFPAGAAAQNWKGTNQCWPLNLPFAFPLGGQSYTTASVSSHGVIHFANPSTSGANTVNGLAASVAAAPLWDRLTTIGDGDDIAVDANAQAVTVVWKAKTVADGRPVNVAARLFPSGAMRFYYGSGNQHTSRVAERDKTIGVAAGTAASMLLGLRNGQPDLGSASALLIQPATLPPPSAGLPWEMLLLQ